MSLSRLDNFLKNVRGNILYVNPNDLDSTDAIENQGNSLTRPFKTIQRALIEAARFSYQAGENNDRFNKTTILLYPGDHILDNRPGWIPYNPSGESIAYYSRDGVAGRNLPTFDPTSNFDLNSLDNDLYPLNSIYGGVIVPRGTSIVGLDLRKTVIRPKYVPDPENDEITRSCLFRLTGGCYLWQFSILDADPNGVCFKDYTFNRFVPNFSHHKLACFEYADGVNNVNISDDFLTFSTNRTDLEMYYQKVGDVYDQGSGRPITPDFPLAGVDIEPKVDEYRIVGSKVGEVGITSIKAGDGTLAGAATTITATLASPLPGIDVDTPIIIDGVSASGYNGQYVVSAINSTSEIQYTVQNTPTTVLENPSSATLQISVDTVTSASPYIFNISLRSVYGMCGLLADGSKASGFKSMVLAQFTGIGLQKDDRAFVKYNSTTGSFDDSTTVDNIHTDSRAIHRNEWKNFHINATNDAILQVVSVFAIGYAEHFVADNGGDYSITNSNSNFGSIALISRGFKSAPFSRDDVGYITHVIPPKTATNTPISLEFPSIDVNKTLGVANTSRLYLYNEVTQDSPPDVVLGGYRVGAASNDSLRVLLSPAGTSQEYSARIIMDNTAYQSVERTGTKRSKVNRSVAGINSIDADSILTFTEDHQFLEGETIRIISENGHLPDGAKETSVYFAIVGSPLADNQIQVAKTLNDAVNREKITLNSTGGVLNVESRVSDKLAGEAGHPVQFDSDQTNWYVNVASAATENSIYPTIVGFGSTAFGTNTPRSYVNRTADTRSLIDQIYRYRYVVPAGVSSARPPIDGYVLQESESSNTGTTDSEISQTTLTSSVDQRNFRFISNADYNGSTKVVTFSTELPHDLNVGSSVEIVNVKSSNNTTGIGTSGFNDSYTVSGITSTNAFTVSLTRNPGTFQNSTSTREVDSLPYFKRKRYKDTYNIYRTETIKQHVPNEQDGIYHISVLKSSVSPTLSQFASDKYSQNLEDLYPQMDRDNPDSDPVATRSYAKSDELAKVVSDDIRRSITRESLDCMLWDSGVGVAVTDIFSTAVGTAHTVYTDVEHKLNGVVAVSIGNSGSGYGSGVSATLHNARLVGASGTIGRSATANITVDAAGGITGVTIIDPGSAYAIGQTMAVTGTATTSGYVEGMVTVTKIDNAIDKVIRVSGVRSDTYNDYNGLFRITGVSTHTKFQVATRETVVTPAVRGMFNEISDIGTFTIVGDAAKVTDTGIGYDNVAGVATFTTSNAHAFRPGQVVKVVGTGATFLDGDHTVLGVSGITSVALHVGVNTYAPQYSTTKDSQMYIFPRGMSNNSGAITLGNENVGGRMVPTNAGITTTLSGAMATATTTTISITNASSSGLKLGDYIMVDDEIMRVRNTNVTSVFRGLFGTKATTHLTGSVVTKLKPIPIGLRRNSIIRASGHTFEYVGFGPGNYSTALPEKQDRVLTPAESFRSQARRLDGGLVNYTGMNNKGDFYIGNILSLTTGEEFTFNTPISKVVGEEDPQKEEFASSLTPDDVTIAKALKVEGGTDGTSVSIFDGPVNFNEKITSSSARGMEAVNLFLQGNAAVSRKISVGTTTPTINGTPGDITFSSVPSTGQYAGWIFTENNEWRRWGAISDDVSTNKYRFDQVGIGTTSILDTSLFQVNGSGSDVVVVSAAGSVGIGTTNPIADLDVRDVVSIAGSLTASIFYGNGQGLTNLPVDSFWVSNSTGITTGASVGIGTTTASNLLTIGSTQGTALNTVTVLNNGQSKFIGTVSMIHRANVAGILSANQFDLTASSAGVGTIYAGIVTAATSLSAKDSVFAANGTVGIRTATVRDSAQIDLGGSTRLTTYFEPVVTLTSSSGEVTVDLSKGNTFNLSLTEDISFFQITNPPTGSTSFTIKLVQDSTGGRTVGISTFKDSGGNPVSVYWGGGLLPQVTTAANKIDIYTFTTFDSGSTLYGLVSGQNFATAI